LDSSNSTFKALAIQGHLNGKSKDKIAKEIGDLQVKYLTINEWKRGIGIPEINELRAFAISV
jgi:transposase